MRSILPLFAATFIALACSAPAEDSSKAKPETPVAHNGELTTEKPCEHGVSTALCTRCNPKLEPVFMANGDWCAEHDRPESQCVICNPELAQKGVK